MSALSHDQVYDLATLAMAKEAVNGATKLTRYLRRVRPDLEATILDIDTLAEAIRRTIAEVER